MAFLILTTAVSQLSKERIEKESRKGRYLKAPALRVKRRGNLIILCQPSSN